MLESVSVAPETEMAAPPQVLATCSSLSVDRLVEVMASFNPSTAGQITFGSSFEATPTVLLAASYA